MIRVVQRLCPFSHLPKFSCLIPTTGIVVEAFPALIRLKNIDNTLIYEKHLNVEGPLKQFTVMQDLERGCVTVFSEKYSYHILPSGQFVTTKNPNLPQIEMKTKLSFGVHKKQEWESIKKRGDLREILPLWFRLGSILSLPEKKEFSERGPFLLLKQCKDAIASNKPETIEVAFKKLFLAGFGGMFVPRIHDDDFQGILSDDSCDISPLYLLSDGAKIISSCFIRQDGEKVEILPALPPEFFAGRMININCHPYGEIDIEWSKKSIRRLILRAATSGYISLSFRSFLRSFRISVFGETEKKRLLCGEPLEIKAGFKYILDRFQK